MLLSTACSFEEANIFPESAAVRLENAKTEYNKVLCSATNGWAMEYFPTDTTRGFTFLVKFYSSGMIDLAAKDEFTNNLFKKDSSAFEMIADNGPVLSFNTYNPLFHIFSNPEDPKGLTSKLDGLGMMGDYEFIVLKADSNEIKLKGKKRGTYIILKRLPDSQSWTDYYAKIDAMNTLLFDKANNVLNFVFGLDTLSAYNGTTHQFKITERGGDPIVEGEFHSFIVTPSGIRLHTPYTHNDKLAQTFILNADNSALICLEVPEAKFVSPIIINNLSSYFNNSLLTWTFNPLLMSSKVKTDYDLLVQSCKTKFYNPSPNLSVKDVLLKLTYSITKSAFVLELSIIRKTSQIYANLYLTPTASNTDFTLSYNGTGDASGLSYYDSFGKKPDNTITGFKEMVAIISSSFTLNTNAPINPINIKFIQKQDAESWFTVTCK